MLKTGLYLAFWLILISACKPQKDPNTDVLIRLVHKEKEILCTLGSIKDSINLTWDKLNSKLTHTLPYDTPSQEKNNMLKVRNASMIRMFKTYRVLDDSFKNTLSEVEDYDKALSEKVLSLKRELTAIANKKRKIQLRIDKNPNSKNINTLAQEINHILNKECIQY